MYLLVEIASRLGPNKIAVNDSIIVTAAQP